MMGYGNKSLNDWRDEVTRTAKEHGFTEATVAEDVALMHSELSELLEDHRRGRETTEEWYVDKETGLSHAQFWPNGEKPRKPCGIPSELADVIIRALHFAGKHGIDIERAVREKALYNETRPFKHGKKL